ncbi:class I SAM-dependent methyltransferase [Mycolicibacterium fluoranthenivorans]|uniref:S-adenosyl-L-methionine-dependent methyltransferase n=1 Tax=Mycolicibacterium fluoranthenivorans TaxID=258505 RepID=A0A7X5TX64_9MYCO|nr:class I SAM-dependent methyltransferase [Mycolicibacterium fluoranthenivorans]MCV7357003.1 class I SAM-dependent methyltransferase [Mycolicibacterium fluoranthenivorans]NIH94401.1 methyltransferase (TIGR00027 family) [Mycolicibacterium fluoranthenivorans]
MARSETDSWDLASSVGATATMVAAARALATAEPDAIIDDPYAADLVRAVGVDFFTRLVNGDIEIPDDEAAAGGIRLITDTMAVRTRFFDDFFIAAGDAGVRQAVILASGLDTRPYRLHWPAGTVVYEIDQPDVLAFKTQSMDALGARPSAQRRTVAIDLREDWPSALTAAGFDPAAPSAWSAEGLLMYLPPDAQDRLFDEITALSVSGGRLATEYHGGDFGQSLGERAKEMVGQWGAQGFDIDLSELFYKGERNDVVDYLSARGWQVHSRSRRDVFADYGRQFPELANPLQHSVSITAIRD